MTVHILGLEIARAEELIIHILGMFTQEHNNQVCEWKSHRECDHTAVQLCIGTEQSGSFKEPERQGTREVAKRVATGFWQCPHHGQCYFSVPQEICFDRLSSWWETSTHCAISTRNNKEFWHT